MKGNRSSRSPEVNENDEMMTESTKTRKVTSAFLKSMCGLAKVKI